MCKIVMYYKTSPFGASLQFYLRWCLVTLDKHKKFHIVGVELPIGDHPSYGKLMKNHTFSS